MLKENTEKKKNQVTKETKKKENKSKDLDLFSSSQREARKFAYQTNVIPCM